jgi:hypothetical protein
MENRFHRYLNLPFEVRKPPLFDQFGDKPHHQLVTDFEYPEVDEWFKSLGYGMFCERVDAFYTPPYGKIPIHTDWGVYTDHAKINTSWGPEEGVIQWWKSDHTQRRQIKGQLPGYTSDHHDNLWANEEDCTFLYEANTNKSSLVNVGVLHGTYNPTDQGRWTLCFMPHSTETENGIITWDDSLKIFNDYIEEQ